MSGLGIALTGIMPTYWLVFASVLLCGVGVGAFHPEAARFSNFVSGPRRATSMSVFSVGGGIGFGLGPAVLTGLVLAFGLPGTILLIIPSLLMAVVSLLELPRLDSFRPARTEAHMAAILAAASDRPAFVRVTAAAMLRSIVYFAAITFSPLYFVHVFRATPAHANTILTLALLAGPVGTLAIGRLADRFGRRTMLLAAFATTTVMLAVFVVSGQLIGSIALILLGAASIATFSLVLVMAQEYMPANLGLASGIVLGLPDGIGGLTAPPLGVLADHLGLQTSLWAAVAVGVVMVALTATLPRAGLRRGTRRESPPESRRSASPGRPR
jgi:FSR family fosmidomycin resistance protein-like MFS transporter